MEIHQIILISLNIINILSKKCASSSESIENLLYFQDCQNKDTTTTSTPKPLERRAAPMVNQKAMDCPFPKMCCSVTCGGNDCGGPSSKFFGQRDVEEIDPMYSPIRQFNGPSQPSSPAMARGRKRKGKKPLRMPLPPMMNTRRDSGFTKDRIKSLINQDEDIRKILKDLVRVTMKKVDLVEMINAKRQAASVPTPKTTPKADYDDYDDDDDLN